MPIYLVRWPDMRVSLVSEIFGTGTPETDDEEE